MSPLSEMRMQIVCAALPGLLAQTDSGTYTGHAQPQYDFLKAKMVGGRADQIALAEAVALHAELIAEAVLTRFGFGKEGGGE